LIASLQENNAMKTIALVGCGRISNRHIQVLTKITGIKLVALCDHIEQKAINASEFVGLPWYSDVNEMVEKEKPDIVSILTESGSHARLAISLAPRVSALVVEKPMALTLEDADELVETCDRCGTRLFVVKQNRYNPPVLKLRRAMERGAFGRLVLGTVRVRWCREQPYYDQDPWRGTWKDDGGVFTNQASHHIDLLQWMMGPVESVKAYTATRLVKIEAEDTGVAILRFKSGALGIIEATTATRPKDLEGSLSILGELGSVVIGGFAVNKLETWNFKDAETMAEGAEDPSESVPNVYGFGHQAFYEDVLGCMETGRNSMLAGLEGRKSLEIINAIYESATTGEEVFLRFVPQSVLLGRGR
jgi:UDP-N-acetyl-2-amino-2-deoxyglucuronate dehydrogenase